MLMAAVSGELLRTFEETSSWSGEKVMQFVIVPVALQTVAPARRDPSQPAGSLARRELSDFHHIPSAAVWVTLLAGEVSAIPPSPEPDRVIMRVPVMGWFERRVEEMDGASKDIAIVVEAFIQRIVEIEVLAIATPEEAFPLSEVVALQAIVSTPVAPKRMPGLENQSRPERVRDAAPVAGSLLRPARATTMAIPSAV